MKYGQFRCEQSEHIWKAHENLNRMRLLHFEWIDATSLGGGDSTDKFIIWIEPNVSMGADHNASYWRLNTEHFFRALTHSQKTLPPPPRHGSRNKFSVSWATVTWLPTVHDKMCASFWNVFQCSDTWTLSHPVHIEPSESHLRKKRRRRQQQQQRWEQFRKISFSVQ